MSNDKPNNVALCAAIYHAEQVQEAVVIYAHGIHPTTGYQVFFDQALIDIFPPQFSLWHVQPTMIVAEAMTPFGAQVSFPATDTVETVIVHDANGSHQVLVAQAVDSSMRHRE